MSKKDNYVIFNPEGGLGKIIASTAVVKAIKKKYPDHKIIVMSPWSEVFLNNPYVHRVFRSGQHPYFYKDYIEGRESVVLKGEPYFDTKHLYQKQHLIQSWCNLHNLPFDGDVKPELYLTDVEKKYYANNIQSDKPILMMQTNGGPWDHQSAYCWTRDIPFEQSQILANELSNHFKIYHITRQHGPQLANVERVQDVPNKRTFLSILLKSQKRLLIDSCLQHAAAAFDLPSTVCWIGTSPDVFGYDMHDNIQPAQKAVDTCSTGLDSHFFDYDFNGPEWEFPFQDTNLFNLQGIVDSLLKK